MSKQRYQVSASYLEILYKTPYPNEPSRIMGYYDAANADDAFHMFLQEHAMTLEQAQWFYNDIMVIPVPNNGFIYKLSDIYGELAKFPNPKYTEG